MSHSNARISIIAGRFAHAGAALRNGATRPFFLHMALIAAGQAQKHIERAGALCNAESSDAADKARSLVEALERACDLCFAELRKRRPTPIAGQEDDAANRAAFAAEPAENVS